MAPEVGVSGLESDGGERFFCRGGRSGKVRAVRRPGRGSAAVGGSKIPVDSTSSNRSALAGELPLLDEPVLSERAADQVPIVEAVLNGRADEIVELARSNLLR